MLEGLPPNNAAYVMTLTCDEATARAVADAIVETFDPAETAAAAFEIEPDKERWTSRDWLVEVYFGNEPDEAMIHDLVAAYAGEEAAKQIVFSRVAERDWVKASLDGLEPVRAGRFLVHGSHDRGRARPNDLALEIEAALAFGTGHHGTTRGCLLMLDRVLKRRRPRRVLDVGTGTGVLAMAAAKALHCFIASGDIDPISVEATTGNARMNGVGPWVKPVVARGVQHPLLQAGAPYDLIFANILAKPLRLLAPSIAALASEDGELILSGLLGPDVAGVLTAYAAQGLRLAHRTDLDGWATLLLTRKGASPRPVPADLA
ncbi:50S ribosomal protein L11 methyltransferase [Methylovirgula sp. 4M-Z18]|uniref:50S ribosomal protein L11 methyltransferase n=1 Tax=Methylovirgula sp. 4M-Z18 TaxID=2293567 RepID=UPI000E2F965D|nr:50S ribosomal protein L11 methyltransferase [Methylovirgula sp. 4M-Z18]RFB79593.1 50S ribosomal protein L11 methyltransferase [Methylovirgula sp. 4M-Z18]